MGKSRNSRNNWDRAGDEKAFSAMDRRDARKKKGMKRDPEADVVDPMTVYYPDYMKRN